MVIHIVKTRKSIEGYNKKIYSRKKNLFIKSLSKFDKENVDVWLSMKNTPH